MVQVLSIDSIALTVKSTETRNTNVLRIYSNALCAIFSCLYMYARSHVYFVLDIIAMSYLGPDLE